MASEKENDAWVYVLAFAVCFANGTWQWHLGYNYGVKITKEAQEKASEK